MSNYILTLQLKTEKFQEDIICNAFDKYRKVYNSCLSELFKRYNHMIESKEHQANCKYKGKDRNKIFSEINKKYNLTEYSLHKFVKFIGKYYKLHSAITQKIATRCFNAFNKYIYHQAKRVNYIRYNELTSIEGKQNSTGISYKDGIIKFNKMTIPVIIKNNDNYAQRAIQDKIKYCRILKKEIKGKIKWYVQLVLEGIPPKKTTNQGKIKGQIGLGNVGIDIGTQTIAISSKCDVKLLELAPNVNNIDRQIKLIQRKMDRSKRATNLNKFNANGTIKQGNRDKWIFSNHYLKLKRLRKELYRKQAEIRKQDHYILINKLLNLGNKFYVETMSYKRLQTRVKDTTINEKTGRINKKKRFGKSLANKAPSMFLTMLDNKLKYNNERLYKIDTAKCRASQYNHFSDEYNKKELKDRWNNGMDIQRDCYSAFLIMNVNEDLKSINRELCVKTYDNFKILHDKERNRLKKLKLNGYKLISSMGI
ncbi:TPA: RNA-guided endonuclease TnpB family protein [Clostridioides difficile]|uniref:transposase n=1 Tax=Clostridioides difficile TaxID=1496 RepID=UPI001A8F4614|nr:transposase [Clostridioides difficile]HCQ6387240.1 transposase [Clostridioides difficile]